MNAASETAGWHDRQRQTLTSYITPNPAIPTDYNCPKGACATPPPPPPISEGFVWSVVTTPTNIHAWFITMGAAAVLFFALTRLTKRN